MVFLALMEYAVLASTFTIAKVVSGLADPLFLIGVRMIAASPIMFIVHRLNKGASFKIAKKHFWLFFWLSLCHITIPFVGEFWALKYVSSTKTAIIYSLTPFIAAILAFFLHKKKIAVSQYLGLAIGLLGILPTMISPDEISHKAGEFLSVSLPELVLLICVVSASYAWFLVAKLMSEGYGISLVNGVAMLLGGLVSLGSWFIFADTNTVLAQGDLGQFIFWMALLVITSNVISYNFYGWLIGRMSIPLMSTVGFSCPIFASIYGKFFLGEELGLSHLIALVMVALGIWLFYRGELSTKKTSD